MSDNTFLDAGHNYHLWYYDNKIWEQTSWLGVKILKSVCDMWNYQEIIYRLRPTLIIEFGTCNGGSALFFATILQTLGYDFKVFSVDITHEQVGEEVRQHPFIELFLSSSIDPQVAERIISLKREYPGKIFAILDSDHHESHVFKELLLLRPLLQTGDYLVVEDSNINGHPVLPGWGEGPFEAMEKYFSLYPDDYQRDEFREQKFGFSFATRGFLIRCVSGQGSMITEGHVIPNKSEPPTKLIFQREYLSQVADAQVPSEFLEFLKTVQQEAFYQHLFARLGRYISLSERNKKLETLAKKQGLGLTYSAQLFIDTGTGFSEPQSIVKTLTGDEQTLEFDVSEYDNIKQLRFDPLSTLITLHLQRIILVDDQKQSHTVSAFRDNAFTRKENNILIFDVEDPQIYIDVPKVGHLRKVIFLLDYLTIGSETLKSVLTVEREKSQQLDLYHSSKGYVVQLFLDIGKGFSEDHCLRRPITGEEPQLEFDLSGYETIKRLRFDPLNAPVIIRLHQIVVYDVECQPHDMTRYETNAYAPPTEDHTLVFDTEDSQIYIDLEGFSTPTKIVFSLEYVTLGSQVLNSILQLERDKFQTLEQQVQGLQQQKNSLEYLLNQHQLPLRYVVQLYLDTGAGFSEKQVLLQEITGQEEAQVFEFDLSGYENLKQLRFDPLNAMTALRIEQMVVVDGQGLTHRLTYQPVNAYAQLGEILVFDTEDSQVLIALPNLENPQKVVIRLQYLAIGTNTYRVILQREREILKQQGEQIRYLTQLVQQLRG